MQCKYKYKHILRHFHTKNAHEQFKSDTETYEKLFHTNDILNNHNNNSNNNNIYYNDDSIRWQPKWQQHYQLWDCKQKFNKQQKYLKNLYTLFKYVQYMYMIHIL